MLVTLRLLPDQAVLKSLLDYDEASGRLFWRARSQAIFVSAILPTSIRCRRWNTRYAGKEAFVRIDDVGYRSGRLLGQTHRAHRVIWKLLTGDDPLIVDHINGDRLDNRWNNLRSTDATGNARNSAMRSQNRSGHVGVSFNRKQRKWVAYICRKRIGSFDTVDAAIAARQVVQTAYAFHPNHGRAI